MCDILLTKDGVLESMNNDQHSEKVLVRKTFSTILPVISALYWSRKETPMKIRRITAVILAMTFCMSAAPQVSAIAVNAEGLEAKNNGK